MFSFIITAPGKVSNFTVTQDPNVTAKTNVHIKWSPPVKRDLNGVIQQYFIQYWYPPNEKTVKLISFHLPSFEINLYYYM